MNKIESYDSELAQGEFKVRCLKCKFEAPVKLDSEPVICLCGNRMPTELPVKYPEKEKAKEKAEFENSKERLRTYICELKARKSLINCLYKDEDGRIDNAKHGINDYCLGLIIDYFDKHTDEVIDFNLPARVHKALEAENFNLSRECTEFASLAVKVKVGNLLFNKLGLHLFDEQLEQCIFKNT